MKILSAAMIKFQFLIGRLGTTRPSSSGNSRQAFQFLIGRLGTSYLAG